MARAFLCVCAVLSAGWGPTPTPTPTLTHAAASDSDCHECISRKVVNLQTDFNKLDSDPNLSKHVAEIIERLKAFKYPVHPRIRIVYELLKLSMREYAHRTADSLYVPDVYNGAARLQRKKVRRSDGDTTAATPTAT